VSDTPRYCLLGFPFVYRGGDGIVQSITDPVKYASAVALYGAGLGDIQRYADALLILKLVPEAEGAQQAIARFQTLEDERQAQLARERARKAEQDRIAEIQRQEQLRQQQEENWARFAESMGQLANNIAQIQQSNGGGSAAGSQSAASSDSSSSSVEAGNYQTMYNRHARQVASISKSLLSHKGTDSTKSSYNRMVRDLRAHQRDMRHISRECKSKGIPLITDDYLEYYDPP